MKLGKLIFFSIVLAVVLPMTALAGQLEDGTAAMESGSYQKAYKLLYPLAEQGDAAAQDCIAAMYCEGLGVEKDEVLGASWYQKAAEQGYAQAQNAIGAMYVNGIGVEQDVNKGLAFIVAAAKQGLDVAKQNAYALYYEEAQSGNVGALHNVAYMCLKGWGGEADPQNCMKLLEVAAQNGFKKSAIALHNIYTEGQFGVEKNAEKAELWGNFLENLSEVQAVN